MVRSEHRFSKGGLRTHRKSLGMGFQGQNYFNNNTKMPFILSTLISHEYIVEFSRGYKTCDVITLMANGIYVCIFFFFPLRAMNSKCIFLCFKNFCFISNSTNNDITHRNKRSLGVLNTF